MIERVSFHHELARLFVTNFHSNEVTLAGITFTISPTVISEATGIPYMGENWYKGQDIDKEYCESYIKARDRDQMKRVFPFKLLEDRCAPLMIIIIKYFTCEGRFSRLYAYLVIILMHFNRVNMINLPYFMFKNIEKMAYIVQRKPYPQQLNSIYHYSLIKIIGLHHLSLLNMPWETFITHEMLKFPQIFSSVHHEEGGPSSHEKFKETETVGVPVFVTYKRCTRNFFGVARQMLYPNDVEGAFPYSSKNRYWLSNKARARKRCKKKILVMSKKDILILLSMRSHNNTLLIMELMSLTWKLMMKKLSRTSSFKREKLKYNPWKITYREPSSSSDNWNRKQATK